MCDFNTPPNFQCAICVTLDRLTAKPHKTKQDSDSIEEIIKIFHCETYFECGDLVDYLILLHTKLSHIIGDQIPSNSRKEKPCQ